MGDERTTAVISIVCPRAIPKAEVMQAIFCRLSPLAEGERIAWRTVAQRRREVRG